MKNNRFIIFLVLSMMILVGNMFIVEIMKKNGEVSLLADEELTAKDVKVEVKNGDEIVTTLDLKENKKVELPPGSYTFVLQTADKEVLLKYNGEPPPEEPVQIEKGTQHLLTLVKKKPKVVKKDKPDKGKLDDVKPPHVPRAPEPPDEGETKVVDNNPKIKENGNNQKDPKDPKVKVAKKKNPLKYVTIGSAWSEDPYRMLVTITSQGAGVRRIELNNKDIRDLEDFTGYLGHLEPTFVKDTGVKVNVVGKGTPAEAAELKPGDIITEIDGKKIESLGDYKYLLRNTKPKQEIKLTVQRGSKTTTLTATLGRTILSVLRPEIDNSIARKDDPLVGQDDKPAFLVTFNKIDGKELSTGTEDWQELKGVDLLTANWELVASDETSATFAHELPKHNLIVKKTFKLEKIKKEFQETATYPAYDIKFSVEVENTGDAERELALDYYGPTGIISEGTWYERSKFRDYILGRGEDKSITKSSTTAAKIADAYEEEELQDLDAYTRETDKEAVAYIGTDTLYFAIMLMPNDRTIAAGTRPVIVDKVKVDSDDPIALHISSLLHTELTLEAKEKKTQDFKIYAGPKDVDLLEEYDLPGLVDYGWFGMVSKPLAGVLHFFYGIVGNYGIAIIMLTILVRLCMFPLSKKQVKGAEIMKKLQPEMEKIKEKYKEDMQARSKATQDLFRKHNYNPMGGCLLLLVQLPIFLGLYRALSYDEALRGASLIPGVRWCSNLAAPDMFHDWSGWMSTWVQNDLWLVGGLGPYLNILPLVTVALFLVQQKMFTPPATNEQAIMTQKMMKYMMIVIGLMFYKVASGLCIYFITSSLWGIAERQLLKKNDDDVNEEEPEETKKTSAAAERRKASRKR